ncbi:dUTP diphosphatase [Martensiomyces pterosporus]|nr:dUTP diphosphatase [Martensiomyces pterosporus]
MVAPTSFSLSTSSIPLRVVRRTVTARLPTRGSKYAAGYDLYASEEATIPGKGGRGVVETGITVGIPPDTYARVAPRSGLAVKQGIDTGAGVVDADYRGTIKVALFNHGEDEFKIRPGDRIAQLILEKICTPAILECDMDELEETERGSNGFGSTGGY